jgi:predicted permease
LEIVIKLLYFGFDVILPLIVGYLLCRFSALKQGLFDGMIVCNLLVVYSALTVLSLWQLEISLHMMYLPLLGILMHVVPGIIAFMKVKVKYPQPLDQGSYLLSAILFNGGTLGGLVAFIFYGESGYAYTMLILLFANLVLFLFCFPLAQHYYELGQGRPGDHISWKKLLLNRNQLPIISLIVGLALSYDHVPRPEIFEPLFKILVHLGAWSALIPVGFALDFAKIRSCWRPAVNILWIKFLAAPLILFAIAYPLIDDKVALYTVLIVGSTPTGINAVLTARLYRLNIHIATAAFVLTTGFYLLVVVPLLLLLL